MQCAYSWFFFDMRYTWSTNGGGCQKRRGLLTAADKQCGGKEAPSAEAPAGLVVVPSHRKNISCGDFDLLDSVLVKGGWHLYRGVPVGVCVLGGPDGKFVLKRVVVSTTNSIAFLLALSLKCPCAARSCSTQRRLQKALLLNPHTRGLSHSVSLCFEF